MKTKLLGLLTLLLISSAQASFLVDVGQDFVIGMQSLVNDAPFAHKNK